MRSKINKYIGFSSFLGCIPKELAQKGLQSHAVGSIWERGQMFQIKYALSLINLGLILAVFILYANIYRKTKSPFSLGLAIFSLAFLFNILTGSPLLHTLCGFRSTGLGPFLIIPDIFTTIALSILVYLTTK